MGSQLVCWTSTDGRIGQMLGDRRSKKNLVRNQYPNAYCDNDGTGFAIYLEPGVRHFVKSNQSAIHAWRLAYERLLELNKQ